MNVIIKRIQPTYDCGIEVDGTPLMLKSISKNDFEYLSSLEKNAKITDIYKFVEKILNKNTAGIVIPAEEVDKLDYTTVAELLRGYTAFLKGFSHDPN